MKLSGVVPTKVYQGTFRNWMCPKPLVPSSSSRSRLAASPQNIRTARVSVDPVQCIWDGSKRFKYKDYTGRIYTEPREITDADYATDARTQEGYTASDLRKAKLQLLEDTNAAEITDKASRVASTIWKRSKNLSKAKRHRLEEQKLHHQQARDDRRRHTHCMQQQLQTVQGMLMQQQNIQEQLKDTSITPLERELLEKLSRMRSALDRPKEHLRPKEELQPPGFDNGPTGHHLNGRQFLNSHLYL